MDNVSAAYVAHNITETTTTTPADISIGKINLNSVQPTDGPAEIPIKPVDPGGNVTSVASSVDSDAESKYVELPENLSTSSANTQELEDRI